MKNPLLGLYNKFRVERTDGKSAPGEKHEHCEYFVLDLNHDPYSRAAIKAYADACQHEFPQLCVDLYKWVDAPVEAKPLEDES